MKQNTVIIYTAIGLELVNIILPQLSVSSILKLHQVPIYICFRINHTKQINTSWHKLKFFKYLAIYISSGTSDHSTSHGTFHWSLKALHFSSPHILFIKLL